MRPFEPVTGPSAWVAADYRDNENWIYRLSPADVQELDAAVARVIASGARIQVSGCWVVHHTWQGSFQGMHEARV